MKLMQVRFLVRTNLATLVLILCLACFGCSSLLTWVRMWLTVVFVLSSVVTLVLLPCTCRLRRILFVKIRRVRGSMLCNVSMWSVYTRLLRLICLISLSCRVIVVKGLLALF